MIRVEGRWMALGGWLLLAFALNAVLLYYCMDVFGQLGLFPSYVPPYAFFCSGCLQLLLIPSLALANNRTSGTIRILVVLLGCALSGFIFIPSFIVLKTFPVIFCFSLFIIYFARLLGLGRDNISCAMGFLLSLFFFTSFCWSGSLSGLELGSSLAVWLSPQAVLGSAIEGFSFAHLPEVYRVWLGPVAPVPSSFIESAMYYFIPFLIIAGIYEGWRLAMAVVKTDNV